MIKKITKWIGLLFGVVVVVVGLAYGGMRLNDGAVEFFPWFTISIGGPFRSGEVVASPESWDFLREVEEMEIQTFNPNTSRTLWIPVVDDKLYIVSGYMSSPIGRLWKQWPTYMEEDNRVLIRVDGKIYEQRLNRITEGPIAAAVMAEIARKYAGAPAQTNPNPAFGQAVTSGSVWLFEVVDG